MKEEKKENKLDNLDSKAANTKKEVKIAVENTYAELSNSNNGGHSTEVKI